MMRLAATSPYVAELGPPSFGVIQSLGFNLYGPDYQNLRRLVRSCRIAMTAINESETSLLALLLPYALKWPAIYHGLLALSARRSNRSQGQFSHYQAALSELQVEMDKLQVGPADLDSVPKILSSSYLLAIFSMSQSDGCWAQHVRGMIAIIRMTDQQWLSSTRLGSFLFSACSHMDISAFSIGRSQRSQKAWLSWMMNRNKDPDHFSVLETTVGYPESLVTLIALISELADDQAFQEHQWQSLPHINMFSAEELEPLSRDLSTTNDLELSLSSWTPPPLPPNMSPIHNVTLRTAWETIRRAAFLFLWRKAGFHANVLRPIRVDRREQKDSYVREIISNVRIIFSAAPKQHLSVGNTMLWPLVVAGCECSSENNGWDGELLELLRVLKKTYSMDHVAYVIQVLTKLWEQKRLYGSGTSPDDLGPNMAHLSLESITREEGLVIPLF